MFLFFGYKFMRSKKKNSLKKARFAEHVFGMIYNVAFFLYLQLDNY